MSAMSEAKKRANKKWNDANMKERYDRVQLVLPKGRKEEIQSAAAACGESVNAYISRAISEKMERERAGGGSDNAGEVSIFSDESEAPRNDS